MPHGLSVLSQVGLQPEHLAKLLMKFPRIIEYRSERTLRPRLDFLKRHGVQQADISKVGGGGAGVHTALAYVFSTSASG